MNLVTYTKEELEENGFHLKRNLTHEESEDVLLSNFYSTRSREFETLSRAHICRVVSDITIKEGTTEFFIAESKELYVKK